MQQFCLKWNNYQGNIATVFDTFLTSEAFADVTLACDGKSIKAHKVILSACSTFFEQLFINNPCKHPIVILKDIHYDYLIAVVQFMYKGEISITQNELPEIIKIAETLKVKGLVEGRKDDAFKEFSFPSEHTFAKTSTDLPKASTKQFEQMKQRSDRVHSEPSETKDVMLVDSEKQSTSIDGKIEERFNYELNSASHLNSNSANKDENIISISPTSIKQQPSSPDSNDCINDSFQPMTESVNDGNYVEDNSAYAINEDVLMESNCGNEFSNTQSSFTIQAADSEDNQVHDQNEESLDPGEGVSNVSISALSSMSIIMTPADGSQLSGYACGICGKRLRYKHGAVRHIRTQHGSEKFDCIVCHKTYSGTENFRSHLSSVHGLKVSFRGTSVVSYRKL